MDDLRCTILFEGSLGRLTRPLAFRERWTTIFPTEFSASAYFPMAGLDDFLSQVRFVFLECGPEMDLEIFHSVVR